MAVSASKKPPVALDIGIDRGDRAKLAELLGAALANTYVLYAKVQGFHWNVTGPMFYSVHKSTEEQYEDLAASIDEIAERIRAIGFKAPTTLARYVREADVKEEADNPEAADMIRMLVHDHEAVAKSLREAVEEADKLEDVFTADLLTARIGKHEQYAWMLRAMVEKSA
ncbi:MAG: Dps family protein [Reyranellaceae bacterium]